MSCDALYVHIPFCESKCPYCDFYSVKADGDLMDRYIGALERALKTQPYRIQQLDTVYFGGGTPSALGGRRLTRLMDAVRRTFTISPDAEITVECNPQSALEPVLRALRGAGVNRLSFGMQSADDRQLRALGRRHTAGGFAAAVKAARQCGFERLSFDLMLATPGQTNADIDSAVKLCAQLGAEHVSAYLLKIEQGTPFAERHIEAECPDEDGQAGLYLHAVEALARQGYEQYEISNFARGGCVARHNLKYWDGSEYLGVGPAAHSFVNGRRFFFPRDLAAFLQADEPFSLCVDDGLGGGAQEYILLRLRLTEGVVWKTLAARFPGYDARALHEKARRIPDGLVVSDMRGLRLTPQGFLVSNAVIAQLLL